MPSCRLDQIHRPGVVDQSQPESQGLPGQGRLARQVEQQRSERRGPAGGRVEHLHADGDAVLLGQLLELTRDPVDRQLTKRPHGVSAPASGALIGEAQLPCADQRLVQGGRPRAQVHVDEVEHDGPQTSRYHEDLARLVEVQRHQQAEAHQLAQRDAGALAVEAGRVLRQVLHLVGAERSAVLARPTQHLLCGVGERLVDLSQRRPTLHRLGEATHACEQQILVEIVALVFVTLVFVFLDEVDALEALDLVVRRGQQEQAQVGVGLLALLREQPLDFERHVQACLQPHVEREEQPLFEKWDERRALVDLLGGRGRQHAGQLPEHGLLIVV